MNGRDRDVYIEANKDLSLTCSVELTSTGVFSDENYATYFAYKKSVEMDISSAIYKDSDFTASYQGMVSTYKITNSSRNDDGRYMCYAFIKNGSQWATKVINLITSKIFIFVIQGGLLILIQA